MKHTLSVITLILFIALVMCISANAEENIKVYNNNEEVILSNELFLYEGEYFLNFNDLNKFGLDISRNDKVYSIISNDCFGKERILSIDTDVITFIDPNDIIGKVEPVDIEYPNHGFGECDYEYIFSAAYLSTHEPVAKRVNADVTLSRRSIEKIGYVQDDYLIVPGNPIKYYSNIIFVDDELYISAQSFGDAMSHTYSFENGRMDFCIADEESVIIDTAVNLIMRTKAPEGGHEVKIYTAYKTGEGNTLDDFQILSETKCIIPENENNTECIIKTPAEKIVDKNIYLVVDFGGNYAISYEEYDFSRVGMVKVGGKQDFVTYSATVNLPSVDEVDVTFTVYAKAGFATYSKRGVIKAGETSTTVEIDGLPAEREYETWIMFDYHKYSNAGLKRLILDNVAWAIDFKSDYTAKYSRSVICTISLPEEYVEVDDVELEVSLPKYSSITSPVISTDLSDWTDKRLVTLNTECRSAQVVLYSQVSASELTYKIINGNSSLCENGFLHNDGSTTSNKKLSKRIEGNDIVDLCILRRKNITVNVSRPESMSLDNDIYGVVWVSYPSTIITADMTIDLTQNPLIPSGKRTSSFEFEIIENSPVIVLIKDINGDDLLLDYCNYTSELSSNAGYNSKVIDFTDDSVNLMLLRCNNVSGEVLCEEDGLKYTITVVCNLKNGEVIRYNTQTEDGNFKVKIPEDTATYTIDVQTNLKAKSYYISDGLSTPNVNDATNIEFVYGDDKYISIEYIIQKPVLPVVNEESDSNSYFRFKNISDYCIDGLVVYVAYYDENETLLYISKTEQKALPGNAGFNVQVKKTNDNVSKARAFVWKMNSTVPLGGVAEKILLHE